MRKHSERENFKTEKGTASKTETTLEMHTTFW